MLIMNFAQLLSIDALAATLPQINNGFPAAHVAIKHLKSSKEILDTNHELCGAFVDWRLRVPGGNTSTNQCNRLVGPISMDALKRLEKKPPPGTSNNSCISVCDLLSLVMVSCFICFRYLSGVELTTEAMVSAL